MQDKYTSYHSQLPQMKGDVPIVATLKNRNTLSYTAEDYCQDTPPIIGFKLSPPDNSKIYVYHNIVHQSSHPEPTITLYFMVRIQQNTHNIQSQIQYP